MNTDHERFLFSENSLLTTALVPTKLAIEMTLDSWPVSIQSVCRENRMSIATTHSVFDCEPTEKTLPRTNVSVHTVCILSTVET